MYSHSRSDICHVLMVTLNSEVHHVCALHVAHYFAPQQRSTTTQHHTHLLLLTTEKDIRNGDNQRG
jgi:hypothetical protein